MSGREVTKVFTSPLSSSVYLQLAKDKHIQAIERIGSDNYRLQKLSIPSGEQIRQIGSTSDGGEVLFLTESGKLLSPSESSAGLGHALTPVERFKEFQVKNFACGHSSVYFITIEGWLYSFGDASDGRLGYDQKGNTKIDRVMANPQAPYKYDTVSAGDSHAVALSKSGNVVIGIGTNNNGQLGTRDTLDIPLGIRIPEAYREKAPRQAVCGRASTFILLERGDVIAFGKLTGKQKQDVRKFEQGGEHIFLRGKELHTGANFVLFRNLEEELYALGDNMLNKFDVEGGKGFLPSPAKIKDRSVGILACANRDVYFIGGDSRLCYKNMKSSKDVLSNVEKEKKRTDGYGCHSIDRPSKAGNSQTSTTPLPSNGCLGGQGAQMFKMTTFKHPSEVPSVPSTR